MKITVFNADDHPILRKGITDLIVETENLEWVGSAENGRDALEKIKAINPDVAVLDIEMPHMTGLQVTEAAIEAGCKTNFILLTLFKDKSFLQNALKVGAKGYLLKESSEKEIRDCIFSVAQGIPFVNASMTRYLLDTGGKQDNALQELSKHEINILRLISRQKTTAEIAEMLFISPKTVGNHRTNISKKLKLSGKQNGLLKWAIENRNLLEEG